MKILLTGRNGQVGWELVQRLGALGELTATGRDELDLADGKAVRRAVSEGRPQLIINAGAYTAVDRAESEAELAQRINAAAPGVLAEEAARLGALLVHYSTDYVFDGEKATPYVEDDAPNPISAYGRSKLEGEARIRASGCRCLILRTSWVYAARGRNFFRTVAARARAGGPLRVVDDQHGVPTTAGFLADATLELLARQAEGLFNLVPSGATTWHGFARAIVELVGVQVAVEPIKSGELRTAATRPKNSVLDNGKVCRHLGHALPDWRALLKSLPADELQ